MKKTLLALAVMAAAGSVNAAEVFKNEDMSVDLYGQIRENVEFSDADGKDQTQINEGSTRFGFNIAYDVNDDLAILGTVEIAADGAELRQHYVGFASDTYGTITFGKQAPLYDDIYGAIYTWYYDLAPYGKTFEDNFWQDSAMRYQFSNDDFWVKGQYNLPENNKNVEMGELYVGKSFGDLSLHIGGAFNKDQTTSTFKLDPKDGVKAGGTVNDTQGTYGEITAEYALGEGTVGATYTYYKFEDKKDSKNDEESNGFHISAIFPVAEKTSVYGLYQYFDFDGDKDETQNFVLGAEYKFFPRAFFYTEYNFNKAERATAAEDDTQNNVTIGTRIYW